MAGGVSKVARRQVVGSVLGGLAGMFAAVTLMPTVTGELGALVMYVGLFVGLVVGFRFPRFGMAAIPAVLGGFAVLVQLGY